MDGKTKAIVAHITLIGWIIALVLNSQQKDEYASFYIRQMLGFYILVIIGGFVFTIVAIIPILGWLLYIVYWIAVVVFWVLSLIGATSGQKNHYLL